MMGAVTSLLVEEGDTVEKGQLLLTIDDRDVVQKGGGRAGHREALKALESGEQNRELIDITYRRYKKMYEEKAITPQEMDQFETQKKVAGLEYERGQEMVKRAAAGLAEAKIYLGFTRVTSPRKRGGYGKENGSGQHGRAGHAASDDRKRGRLPGGNRRR